MPIKFSTIFIVSVILTLLVSLGPIMGSGAVAGVVCVWIFVPSTIVRFILGAVVILYVGIPALIGATLLYGLIYGVYKLVDQNKFTSAGVTPHQVNDGIIDAEFTEVKSNI